MRDFEIPGSAEEEYLNAVRDAVEGGRIIASKLVPERIPFDNIVEFSLKLGVAVSEIIRKKGYILYLDRPLPSILVSLLFAVITERAYNFTASFLYIGKNGEKKECIVRIDRLRIKEFLDRVGSLSEKEAESKKKEILGLLGFQEKTL